MTPSQQRRTAGPVATRMKERPELMPLFITPCLGPEYFPAEAFADVCLCRECFEHLHSRCQPLVIGDADLNARIAGGKDLVEHQVAF